MKLNMQIIADYLEDYSPTLHNVEGRALNLFSPKLLVGGGHSLASDYLYVATWETLSGYAIPSEKVHLLCVGAQSDEPILQSWDFSCIFLGAIYDLTQVFNEILDLFSRFSDCNARMLSAISNEEPMEQCLEIAAEMFSNPIFLLDTALTRIAFTKQVNGQLIDEEKWHSIVHEGRVTVKTLNSVMQRVNNTENEESVKFESVNPHLYNSITAAVHIDGKRVGRLIIPDDFKKMGKGHLALAEYIAGVTATMLKRYKIKRGMQSSLIEQFMSNILNGQPADDKTLEHYLSQINWKLHDRYYLIKLVPKEGHMKKELVYYDLRAIKSIFGDCFYLSQDDYQLFIINCRLRGELNQEALVKLDTMLVDRGLVAGVSLYFDYFAFFSAQFRLATDAVAFGLAAESESRVYLAQKNIHNQFVSLCNNEINVLALCHPDILKLREYDRRNNTHFLDSLYSYIVNERSLLKASADLMIHRNTLVYRLERVADIINIDYNDSLVRFHVRISCDILRFYEKGVNRPMKPNT